MLTIARAYLIIMAIALMLIGLAALAAPEAVSRELALLPQAGKGLAELRGLYGGLFIAWGVIMLWSIRATDIASGLLIAMIIMMGTIAAARLVSLVLDREPAFNVPALVFEGLIAVASWVIFAKRRQGVTAA
jgi:hypothetical protein